MNFKATPPAIPISKSLRKKLGNGLENILSIWLITTIILSDALLPSATLHKNAALLQKYPAST